MAKSFPESPRSPKSAKGHQHYDQISTWARVCSAFLEIIVGPKGLIEEATTINFAHNDCGYIDNSRIAPEFPCPEQSPYYLYTYKDTFLMPCRVSLYAKLTVHMPAEGDEATTNVIS